MHTIRLFSREEQEGIDRLIPNEIASISSSITNFIQSRFVINQIVFLNFDWPYISAKVWSLGLDITSGIPIPFLSRVIYFESVHHNESS